MGEPRERAVVVVPIYRAAVLARRAIVSLAETTPKDSRLILIDDGGQDPGVDALLTPDSLDSIGAGHAEVIRNPRNLGFPGTVNVAIQAAGSHDVVVVNSDVVVAPGWYEALTAAAERLPRAATLSVMANNGTMLSTPYRNQPRPDFPILERAGEVADAAESLKPIEISNAVGHLLYLTHAAIHAVGLLDEAYAPGYGEEVDFSLRAAEAGFVNYLVPGVAVHHEGSGSFGPERAALVRRNSQRVQEPYPYVWARADTSESDETGALARAFAATTLALRPISAHLLNVEPPEVGVLPDAAGGLRWTSELAVADVVVVPVGRVLPETIPVASRQRVVVLFERTELISRQWMHADVESWKRWMGRARTLCVMADMVLARAPESVLDAGLASPERVRQLHPRQVGIPRGEHDSEIRRLLLGPVDSGDFLAQARDRGTQQGGACVVGQPTPETWTRPQAESGLRDGVGMSTVTGYQGRRSLDGLREAAGWPMEAEVWSTLVDEVLWAAGGQAEIRPALEQPWSLVRFTPVSGPAPQGLDEGVLAGMAGPMNPARGLVRMTKRLDAILLDPPTPGGPDDAPLTAASRRLWLRSAFDSLRYEGFSGSVRKARRRWPRRSADPA